MFSLKIINLLLKKKLNNLCSQNIYLFAVITQFVQLRLSCRKYVYKAHEALLCKRCTMQSHNKVITT